MCCIQRNKVMKTWKCEPAIHSHIQNDKATDFFCHKGRSKKQIEWNGKTKIELSKFSSVYADPKEFCECLKSAVNTMMYSNDVNQWSIEQKVSSIISNKQHLKVMPEEEIACKKWNISIPSAKDTVQVTTQCRIQLVIHPMTRCLQVEHSIYTNNS